MSAGAAADLIIGQATAIDGDTFEIRGQRIRLSGMYAFEVRQACKGADCEDYGCGRHAAFALDGFIGRRNVACEPNGKHWDRIVAVCSVDDDDLGGWMVSQGHAVDDDLYEPSYWWAEGQSCPSAHAKPTSWSSAPVTPWGRSATQDGEAVDRRASEAPARCVILEIDATLSFMCGRYVFTSPLEAIQRMFKFDQMLNLGPSYNVAPTHEMPIVRRRKGDR